MSKALMLTVGILATLSNTARAQGPAPTPATHDVGELAKKTQNPVGDLVSVPFQFNFTTGGDLGDGTFFNLNFQPVVPFKLTANWNAIARTIIPIDSVPGSDTESFSGVGDIQEQIYLTPSKGGPFTWGAGPWGLGPALSLPTATAPPLRTGTWAAGLTGVVVKMAGPWVLGGLVSQWWPMSVWTLKAKSTGVAPAGSDFTSPLGVKTNTSSSKRSILRVSINS